MKNKKIKMKKEDFLNLISSIELNDIEKAYSYLENGGVTDQKIKYVEDYLKEIRRTNRSKYVEQIHGGLYMYTKTGTITDECKFNIWYRLNLKMSV